jgi:hypothetical protein
MSLLLGLAPIKCSRCERLVHPGRGDYYLVRIDADADPALPEFTEEEMAIDYQREPRNLIGQTKSLTAEQAMNQVRRKFVLVLCIPCYSSWIDNPVARLP